MVANEVTAWTAWRRRLGRGQRWQPVATAPSERECWHRLLVVISADDRSGESMVLRADRTPDEKGRGG